MSRACPAWSKWSFRHPTLLRNGSSGYAAYFLVGGAAFIVGFICLGLFVWRQLRIMPAKAWASFSAIHEHMSQVFTGPQSRSNKRLLMICVVCANILVACWVSGFAFDRFVVGRT